MLLFRLRSNWLTQLALVAWVGLAGTMNSALGQESPASDPEAEALMRKAHLARSSWDENFPGFSARLAVAIDGKRFEGMLRVSHDGRVELTLPDDAARQWATQQLESICQHRFAGVSDTYDVSFADDQVKHPLGRLIRFHGGTTHSVYRIKDDVITEVHRRMEKVRFTISVTDVARNPEGRTLPSHFNVSYWNLEGDTLQSNHDFTDRWVRLGQYDLPKSRLLIQTGAGERKVFLLELSDHQLTASKPQAER